MKITITTKRPDTKPIREYETRFIYVGFKFRYDTHNKILSSFERQPDGSITYTEVPTHTDVFSQAHSTENVRVIVYSDSPKMWVEETSPTDSFVFSELGDKVLR
jgi:hypothetical protein